MKKIHNVEQIRSESAARGLQYKFNEQTNWTELLKILKAHENDKKYFKPLINYEYLGGLVLILMWMMARMNAGGSVLLYGAERWCVAVLWWTLAQGDMISRGICPNTVCLEALPNRYSILL